ncbi:hypothetical protein PM082_018621 [Marasmius tenuissimus]|nr:hypothetical protein PM082_018621 [Marasmius tenuissimus]
MIFGYVRAAGSTIHCIAATTLRDCYHYIAVSSVAIRYTQAVTSIGTSSRLLVITLNFQGQSRACRSILNEAGVSTSRDDAERSLIVRGNSLLVGFIIRLYTLFRDDGGPRTSVYELLWWATSCIASHSA